MLRMRFAMAVLAALGLTGPCAGAERLVIDLDLENDVVNLTHAIDGFFFPPTMNRSRFEDRDLNAAFTGEVLRNHLAATAIVRIDGEIAGFATEQEVVNLPTPEQKPYADSAWLITLNRPGLRGVIAVTQREDATGVFGLTQQATAEPDRAWPDAFQRVLSTSGPTYVQHATGDLAVYQGGLFEEYNFVNQADFKRLQRFRARIQFVVYPKGASRAEPPP
jgi:hypothetical protein